MSGSFAGLLASVKVASVALAGGLMVRLSIAGASLAGKDISNIVMSDPWVYFRSSDENYNGYFIRVDLTTNTPTVMANKYSANGVYFTNEFFKKALVSINSGQNSGLTRATTGTINSYTVTVSTNTSIGLCYTVTGTGIPANTIVTSINGTVLTLSKRLTSTISNVILTYSPFGNNVQGLFNYNNTNAGPAFVYTNNHSTTIATTVQDFSMQNAYIPFLPSKFARNTDGSFWFGGTDDTNNPNFSYLPQIGLYGFKGAGDGAVNIFENSSGIFSFCDLTNDSTNNALVLTKRDSSSTEKINLTKLSYTLPVTQLWSKDFTFNGVNLRLAKPTLFTYNGVHYITGQRINNGEIVVIRVDSNGTVIWARTLSGLSTYSADVSIQVLASGANNAIYLGYNADGGIGLAKIIDSFGVPTLTWQTIFKPQTGLIETVPYSNLQSNQNSNVSIWNPDFGFIYVLSKYAFNTGVNVDEPFILKLPEAGTVTTKPITLGGKTFTYTASNYTFTTPSVTSTNAVPFALSNYGAYQLTTNVGTIATPAITPSASTF